MRWGWVSHTDTAQLVARSVRASVAKARRFQERRKSGRVRSERSLTCNLGTVLDLSRRGLRVLSRRRLKGERVVKLSTYDHRLNVLAKVVWCERVGFRQHIAGLEFTTVTPELARDLMAFATCGGPMHHEGR